MKNVDNKHKAHRNDKMASHKSSKVSAILIGIIVLAALVFSIVAPNQFNSLYEAIIGRPAETVSPFIGNSPDAILYTPNASPSSENESAKTLEAFFVDVGQGDCIFLRSPNGKTMLVDCGELSSFPAVEEFLKSQNVERLDVVVATHPHSDHIGGMAKVIDNYKIGKFYMPAIENTSSAFEAMISALEEKEVNVIAADASTKSKVSWDSDVEVRILSPFSDIEYSNLNCYSVVMRIKFAGTALMLTGDCEKESERIMLDRLPTDYFTADILKLGHHGSSTSTSVDFLTAVNPSVAIAMLGKDNSYGHPHRETLKLMKDYALKLYRTDKCGAIRVVLDGKTVAVFPERKS